MSFSLKDCISLKYNLFLQNGSGLLTGGHYAASKIETLLKQVNEQWEELCAKTLEKGQKLREANAQHTYNRTLEDAKTKLDELENSLASDDLGHDLRSVKKLLKRHQVNSLNFLFNENE